MAGRYLISGTELGILMAYCEGTKGVGLTKKIKEEGFIGNSDNTIECDAEKLNNMELFK